MRQYVCVSYLHISSSMSSSNYQFRSSQLHLREHSHKNISIQSRYNVTSIPYASMKKPQLSISIALCILLSNTVQTADLIATACMCRACARTCSPNSCPCSIFILRSEWTSQLLQVSGPDSVLHKAPRSTQGTPTSPGHAEPHPLETCTIPTIPPPALTLPVLPHISLACMPPFTVPSSPHNYCSEERFLSPSPLVADEHSEEKTYR